MVWTRTAMGVVLLLAAVLGCSTQLPTPSPQPTPTAAAATTSGGGSTVTPPPAPFPETVLGLPVLTVDAASRLLLDGKLDGRAVAIAGFWNEPPIIPGCPMPIHQPVLDIWCYFTTFTDQPDNSGGTFAGEQSIGVLVPLVADETEGTAALWGRAFHEARHYVLIAHAGDVRLWQCAADRIDDCRQRLVIDRIAWADGVDAPLDDYNWHNGKWAVEPSQSLAEIAGIAAGTDPPEAVLTAFPLPAEKVGLIEPRLAALGDGVVWLSRVVVGQPDSDGVFAEEVRLIDDASRSPLGSVPLSLPADYQPARLILDHDGSLDRLGEAYPWFTLEDEQSRVIASDQLGFLTQPLVLGPGAYRLRAWIGNDAAGNFAGATCEMPIQLEQLSDASFTATFNEQEPCNWHEGAPGS